MITKSTVKKAIIICSSLLVIGYYIFTHTSTKVPAECPTTTVRYNGSTVQTSLGDHNWIPRNGGSSYITKGDYAVGLNTTEFKAKLGDAVHIMIPKNPLSVKVTQILDADYKHKDYSLVKEGKEYIFTLPNEKGEYIFNVMAFWDTDKHNSSTIFKVEVQ